MRRSTILLAILAASLAGLAGRARADQPVAETQDSFTPALRLGVEGGIATPLDVGGVFVEAQPARSIALDAGVGVGDGGLHEAVMVRQFSDNLGIGFGVSTGPWNEQSAPDVGDFSGQTQVTHWDRVWWGNIEVSAGIETTLRAALGISIPLSGADGGQCLTCGVTTTPSPNVMPYVSFSYALPALAL
jgi:hypothetical protein